MMIRGTLPLALTYVLVGVAALGPTAAALAQQAGGGLGPIARVDVADGPEIVLRPMSGIPLVTVRMAIAIEGPSAVAGAARVLQRIAATSLEAQAARQGATIRVDRHPRHAVYTISGPVGAFERYAEMLREAVAEPSVTPQALKILRTAIRRELAAELDTPEPRLRHRLRTELFPELPDGLARDGAVAVPTPDALRAFWQRSFRPENTRVVVAGAVDAERVESAFRDWPAPAGPARALSREAADEADAPESQTLFPWVGIGYRARNARAETLAIAAALVAEQTGHGFLRTARAELWWLADGERALALIGSATPREERAFTRSATAETARADSIPDAAEVEAATTEAIFSIAEQLRTAVSRAAALVTPQAVERVRRALRRDMLFAARSPSGMAELLGQFGQRSGRPERALEFYDGLEEIDAAQVHTALIRLLDADPVTVEVRP